MTARGANIAFIDYDRASWNPDRLTGSLNLSQNDLVDELIEQIRVKYRREIRE